MTAPVPHPSEQNHNHFAIEVMTGDDWGDGPVEETGYDYETFEDAVADAHRRMAKYDSKITGTYVVSKEHDEDDQPIVFELIPAEGGS